MHPKQTIFLRWVLDITVLALFVLRWGEGEYGVEGGRGLDKDDFLFYT